MNARLPSACSQTAIAKARPAVGIGYRTVIDEWTRANLACFDLLEITVDHCMVGGEATRAAIYDFVGRIPLTAHGIGLSLGTDEPLDFAYLDHVARVVERLGAPAYSEHLAFTRVGSQDLARLLPLPKTRQVAESIIAKVHTVQSRVPGPFLLENIAHVFEWPDRELSDVEFFTFICRETGAGVLLDVENLYLNHHNHGIDPYAFIDALPAGVVKELHIAGGETVHDSWRNGPFLSDSHNRQIPDAALDLLEYTLARHTPTTIVLERDDRIEDVEEMMDDLARVRARIAAYCENEHEHSALKSSG